MKLTQVLLAGAVVLAASGAMAYDLDHPFWGPAQGQFASDTTYSYNRKNANEYGVNAYSQTIAETVSYGITDNWTVALNLSKDWDKGTHDSPNDKGNEWGLKTSYNVINDGKLFVQVGTGYAQYVAEGTNGWDRGSDGMHKIYGFNVKGGVNMGKVTPYAEAYWNNTLNEGKDNDPWFGLRMAAFTNLTQRVGLDAGLSYGHETSDEVKGTYKLDAALSYLLCENVSVRAFGDYLLHNHQKKHLGNRLQRDYTLGLGAKVAF